MNAARDPFADAQPGPDGHRPTEPLSVPEANQRRWSGKKTAVVAALAVGLSSTVAVGAANALPLGSQAGGGDSGRTGGPGGHGGNRGMGGFEGGSPGGGRFGQQQGQSGSGSSGSSGSTGSTGSSGSGTGGTQGESANPEGGTPPQGTPPQGGPNFQGEVPGKSGSNPMPSTPTSAT